MNYRELERYIQNGRSDAFITINAMPKTDNWINYSISISQDQAGMMREEHDAFSINLETGDFKFHDLDLVGECFGIDRKKFVLDYVSRTVEEWNNSIDKATVAVITVDQVGNMVVVKKIVDENKNSHFNFLKDLLAGKPKIEYEILSADTDLSKLPNNYYFDQSETFELDGIVKKTNEEFGNSNGEYFPKGFIHFKTVYFEGE